MNGLVSGYGSDSEDDENLGEAVVNNGAEKNVSSEYFFILPQLSLITKYTYLHVFDHWTVKRLSFLPISA